MRMVECSACHQQFYCQEGWGVAHEDGGIHRAVDLSAPPWCSQCAAFIYEHACGPTHAAGMAAYREALGSMPIGVRLTRIEDLLFKLALKLTAP